MATTFICKKCKEAFRVSELEEDKLEEFKNEHKKICDGKIESIWKNYDKMSKEQKENLGKQILFRHGKLGKLKIDED